MECVTFLRSIEPGADVNYPMYEDAGNNSRYSYDSSTKMFRQE